MAINLFIYLDYSEEKIGCILDAELANTVGNLLSRCSSKALNPKQVFPAIDLEAFQEIASKDVTKKLIELVASLPGTFNRFLIRRNNFCSILQRSVVGITTNTISTESSVPSL